MVSREELKLLLEVQQKAYKDAMEILVGDVTDRLRKLEKQNDQLRGSLEYTQKEVDTLKSDNEKLKEELCDLKKDVMKKSGIAEKMNEIQDRLNYQEDYSRRNNIRLDGIEERPNESWEETQEKVQRLLRDKLKLGSATLERAHRVGPRPGSGSTRPRTVVARFACFGDRQQAMKNSFKLKNTNIFLNEDLCESSVLLRKAQLPALKKAKAEGKIAFFRHTKLIIRDRGEQQDEQRGQPGPVEQQTSVTAVARLSDSRSAVVSSAALDSSAWPSLKSHQLAESEDEMRNDDPETRSTRQRTKKNAK